MLISSEELKHIATLAKLTVSEREFENFKKQFEHVLEFVSQLKEVDISDIESTALGHINNESNNWRDDSIIRCEKETRSALLREAPETVNGLVKVPGVFDT